MAPKALVPVWVFFALYTMAMVLIVGAWPPCTWGFSSEIQLPLLDTTRVVLVLFPPGTAFSLSVLSLPSLAPSSRHLLRTRH